MTDVILPDTSGPEMAAELWEERAGLEVLYMSGYTDDALAQDGVLEEGAAYIEKLFRPRELLRKVWTVLSRHVDGDPGAPVDGDRDAAPK